MMSQNIAIFIFGGQILPIKSCSVGNVLTSQVLEHVIDQDMYIRNSSGFKAERSLAVVRTS